MGEYGDRDGFIAPRFELRVQGMALTSDVTQFIQSVEYESAESMVEVMEINLANPDFVISERKLFLPGNKVALWGGYDTLAFLGQGVITKVKGVFPEEGMPGLKVTAYTYDHFMNQKKPDPDKKGAQDGQRAQQVWGRVDYADAVRDICKRHKLEDVDPDGNETIEASKKKDSYLFQEKDVTDFDFCNGLANLIGWYFWVDGWEDGKWRMHFQSPSTVQKLQKKKYTFRYNAGDFSTLMNFEPEMLVDEFYTKVTAEVTLPSGKVIQEPFIYADHDWSTIAKTQDEKVEGALGTASQIKVFLKDYSIEVPNTAGVKTAAQLKSFVETWLARHQNEFMLGSGQVVGLETLKARQIHALKGMGTVFDGDWLFSKVRHVFDSGSGYTCSFSARRID